VSTTAMILEKAANGER